jgi:pilus assembly protein CpaF
MVNDPQTLFVRRHRGPSGYHDEVFHDDDHVVRTLTKLLDDASSAHRKLDPADGLQDAQLDNGARVHIVHGDVARGGHGSSTSASSRASRLPRLASWSNGAC